MVEFKISGDDSFYILRSNGLEESFVYDKLESAIGNIKSLIKEGIGSSEIEVMSIQLKGNKISAEQVSWGFIAEKLIMGE